MHILISSSSKKKINESQIARRVSLIPLGAACDSDLRVCFKQTVLNESEGCGSLRAVLTFFDGGSVFVSSCVRRFLVWKFLWVGVRCVSLG